MYSVRMQREVLHTGDIMKSVRDIQILCVAFVALMTWVIWEAIPPAGSVETVRVSEYCEPRFTQPLSQPRRVVKISKKGSMTTIGPVGVGASAEITRGGSTGFWDNDGNLSTNGTSSPLFNPAASGYSNFIAATDFDFSAIPTGSTIDGIEVVWTLQDIFNSGEFADESSYLTKDGSSSVGSNLATSTTIPGSSTPFTYGGSSSLWGTTWTAAEVKSSNFGALFAFSAASGAPLAYAIYCEITVYYTAPDSPPCAFIGLTKSFGPDGDLLRMLKNTAGQKIGSQMITAADGTAFTGSVTVSVTGDAGTQATGSVGSGACTHEGNGYHTYAPSQAETNYDLVAFTFTGTGAVPATVQVATQTASGGSGDITSILGTAITEGASGRLAAAFTAFLNVASPVLTVASVNQTGDSYARIGANGASLTDLATQASVNTIDDFLDTEIAAIKTKTDQLTFTVANQVDSNALSGGGGLDAAGVRAAVGLASANLDTQLGAIDDFLDTEVAAIKAKTDNLPSDPADASDIASSFSTVNTKLDTIDDFLDTEVAAIKTKTDQLTFTVANKVDATATLSAADSMVLSSGTATAGGNKTITLQTALGADNMGIGCKIKITSGTGALQMRRITGYVNSTKVVTVDRAWTTNPDNTSVYSVVYDSDVGPTVCKYGAAFTSSAGTTLKISAWLERDGQAVVLASGSCTVTYRENASGSDLFTITDSAPNAQGIFEMSQTSPGFTSDRLQVASIEITVGNDTWITREPVPVFG